MSASETSVVVLMVVVVVGTDVADTSTSLVHRCWFGHAPSVPHAKRRVLGA